MFAAQVHPDDVVGIGARISPVARCSPCLAVRGHRSAGIDRWKNTPLAVGRSCGSITAPKAAVDRINLVARERNEPWLGRYGGTIGIEWFFPKIPRDTAGRADGLRRDAGLD